MLKDDLKKNRSYRAFDETVRLSREELTDLVDLTRYTASSVNQQPLKYYIADSKEEVAQILPLTMWAKALPKLQLPPPGKGPAAFILICQDLQISENVSRFQKDVGIVAQTMLLGAVEKGYGGCMIGSFKKDALKELLKLPPQVEPSLLVALGKPVDKIVLTSVNKDGSTNYYRDDAGIHYVPKRELKDILL